LDSKLYKKLEDRRIKGTLRSLSLFEGVTDFISNDYLGLSYFDEIKTFKGSTGSRLISGNSSAVESVEESLAAFYGYDSSLCFNSGYDANLGVLSAIPQKGDVILYDEFVHASVRDGIRLSHANAYSFRHNDLGDLKRLLDNHVESTCYVAVESLYSMHGDMAPLQEIAELVRNREKFLIVDEAHAGGVFGERGRGLTSELQIDELVSIKLITYGKAYGGHGACVLCEKDMRQFLINYCRPFIFSTALPIESYLRMEAISQMDFESRRTKLFQNIALFRSLIDSEMAVSEDRSPIQIIRGTKSYLLNLVEKLKDLNIAAKAIFPPTVAEGDECIRICLHSYNTREEIELLASLI